MEVNQKNTRKVAQIRKEKEVQKRFFNVSSDIMVYSMYVMLLMMICADIRDEGTLNQNNAVRSQIYRKVGTVVRLCHLSHSHLVYTQGPYLIHQCPNLHKAA